MTLAIGVGFHFLIGYRSLPLPLVGLVGAALVFMLIAGRIYRTQRVIHWMTGIPFAVVTTATVAGLALIGGIVPKESLQTILGVPSVWSSWPFLLSMVLMLLNLVGSVGKRSWPLNYTNIVYLASHAGLAIALIGGAASALTIQRRTLVLFEGVPTSKAQVADGSESTLPFEVTLRKFVLESYPPTLALATADEKAHDGLDIVPGTRFLDTAKHEALGSYRIEVLKYLPRAVLAGETWREVPWATGAPAALIRVSSRDSKPVEGWVSCGSVESSGALLAVSDKTAIVMPEPRPRRFRSEVDIHGKDINQKAAIEVNKKHSVAGYDLYQLSYEEKMGAASPFSVLEVVQDRGLPVVYAGIFIMLLGCALHLGNGMGGKR